MQWPNISANDPYPGSGSKNLNLNQDHFWLDNPVKDLCFFRDHLKGNFWSSKQPIVVYEFCTSLSCTLCAVLSL